MRALRAIIGREAAIVWKKHALLLFVGLAFVNVKRFSIEGVDAMVPMIDEAIARGIFGVPSFEFDGRLFWGVDGLPMLRAALLGEPWFDGPAWDAAARPRPGVVR